MEKQPTVAIIPARGGSKRVPGKNLLALHGRPLLAHTIESALAAEQIDQVHVSTEDADIATAARQMGAQVIQRPLELALDTASSESALVHALGWLRTQGVEPGLVALLQCTSPVRAADDIDRAIDTLSASGADSLLSVCSNNRFLWSRRRDGQPYSINYDFRKRPRGQDMEPQFQENGSIYLFRPWVLDTFENRLGGKVAIYEMDFWNSFEIDSTDDVELCRWILQRRDRSRAKKFPDDVELLVLDFDGVMTDNRVWMTEDGVESAVFNRGDGLGIARLRGRGIEVAVLSSETNPLVARRCQKLSIACLQGVTEKSGALQALAAEFEVELERVVYVGNDLNDLDCLRMAGFGIAVADAVPEVLEAADLILSRTGGHGAVRELCDHLIAAMEDRGGNHG